MKQDGSLSSNRWNDKFDRMKAKNSDKKKAEYKRKEKYRKDRFSDDY
tara:strand:- start:9315 stop:9455 length:141 start_codon:yes stop_codon:yes gene_type:complete